MKTDLRVQKTKKAIEEAFIFLVEKYGYSKIKMVDIATKANVNRNTIYLHYASKEEIITSYISDCLENQFKGFDKVSIAKLRNNKLRINKIFESIFSIIDQKADLYRVLLLETQLVGYFRAELLKMKKNMLAQLKETTKNDLLLIYYLNGVFGILTNYVMKGDISKDENINLLTDLTITSMRKLQYK